MDYRAVGTLKLSQPNSSGNSVGGAVNNWNVKLNSKLPLDVTANLGAGEANLDLGKLNLNDPVDTLIIFWSCPPGDLGERRQVNAVTVPY